MLSSSFFFFFFIVILYCLIIYWKVLEISPDKSVNLGTFFFSVISVDVSTHCVRLSFNCKPVNLNSFVTLNSSHIHVYTKYT